MYRFTFYDKKNLRQKDYLLFIDLSNTVLSNPAYFTQNDINVNKKMNLN